MPDANESPSLLDFSDDWGRHPSSCQHLIRALLPTHPTAWVDTIGTRTPKLDLATLRRAKEKLRHWVAARDPRPAGLSSIKDINSAGKPRERSSVHEPTLADSPPSHAPKVLRPRMWPWFTRGIDRRLNRALLESQLKREIAQLPKPVVALTTLPITADLVGRLPVDGWLYYCVDDFSQWPGLDGRTLGRMEEQLVRRVDHVVAVSETLQERIAQMGRRADLLTHGCDLEHWARHPAPETNSLPTQESASVACGFAPPIILFWGVIDPRMDVAFLRRLSESLDEGTILLVGPSQDPDPALREIPRIVCRPPVPFDELPALAASASVLVMPYADLAVTRAMQPLKLKEYLATGKPAVVRALPSTTAWSDSLDECRTPEEFAARVLERVRTGLPESQRIARARLATESWSAKARELEHHIARALDRPARQVSPQRVASPNVTTNKELHQVR